MRLVLRDGPKGVMRPKHLPIAATLLLAALLLVPSDAAQARRYASIVVDADTGEVLHARHPNRQAYPASLTKMMTLYMVFEALEKGKLQVNQRLPVSKRAASMPPSKLRLKRGSSIAVKDAILALVTKSANDVAVVVAEALGGSESNFAKMMTRRARELGMTRTVFRNASGLPNSKQLSTASDMAKLAQALLRDFPVRYRYFATRSFKYNGRSYRNHNNLLKNYKGTDGIKTGYTHASGYNLAASAVRANKRLIAVVFGGKTARSRDRHMHKLLNKAFKAANRKRVPPLSQPPPRKPGLAPTLQVLVPEEKHSPAAATANATDINATAKTASETAGAIPRRKPSAVATPPAFARIPARRGDQPEQGSTNAQAKPKTPAKPQFKPVESRFEPEAGPAALHWGIQVGAFRRFASAHLAAHEATRKAAKYLLQSQVTIRPIKGLEGQIYRARVVGMTERNAHLACDALKKQDMSCHVVPPNRS